AAEDRRDLAALETERDVVEDRSRSVVAEGDVIDLDERIGSVHRVASRIAAGAQRGRSLVPIRNSSIARAACRPSRIAQTTSDWPRRMSPAANTFSTLVAYPPSASTCALA